MVLQCTFPPRSSSLAICHAVNPKLSSLPNLILSIFTFDGPTFPSFCIGMRGRTSELDFKVEERDMLLLMTFSRLLAVQY